MASKSGYPCTRFRVLVFALVTVLLLPLTSFAGDPDEEAERDHPIEREQWFLHGRTYQGKVAPQLLEKAQQQRDTLRHQAILRAQVRTAVTPSSGTPTPVWTPLGPAPMMSTTAVGNTQDYGFVTGRATTVAVDQNDPTGNTVYLGGAYGGVWKSNTAANSDITQVFWKPIIDDQATTAVGAIAIQPGNGNIVLVGTGEANSSTDSYYGLGILRSTDAGNSWTLITSANGGKRLFHGLGFSKFAFSTDNPNLVVASTAAASEGITVGAENPANNPASCANAATTATCRGLYYSLDAGVTWNQVTMSDGPGLTPDNGSASSVVYNSQQHKFYAAARAHGFYISSDGITFTRMGSDTVNFTFGNQPNTAALTLANCPSVVTNTSLTTCPLYRGEIAVVPGRNEMYVWYVDASTTPVNGGIYQTIDGKNWIALNVNGITNCGDSAGCGTDQGAYNLALAAIPNGATATDLYAGAINIFRCQINTANPTCTTNSFVNLTHVYGCSPTGSISKVHPDQHWIDFFQFNTGQTFIYFANDGGIYRSLDPFTTQVKDCKGTVGNVPTIQFDNLNGTMGSMTQFVWFSQHPSNQFTLLGGTQDNGSPVIDSTNSSPNGLTWHSVQGGDGGFNDIHPNGNDWFASFTRVQITHCAIGASCTDSQFQTIVNSGKVGGDSAAFYMPYMLDPQDSSKLIIGTCRVWRTTTAGASGIALSQNFATGVQGASCPSTSSTFVNALAAGGPSTSNGSQVIYTGTDDGRVFATTSADSSNPWTTISDTGGFSNPSAYPISAVAIDPRVAAGTTAYVTVMGFRTSHVWQTTNAGTLWTDVTGNLPDSPANAVVVDKSSGAVYVGTDVGVFSTDTPNGASTVWAEVGPATGVGTLPNVAVTRIAIFAPADQPARLRVSTYGRGVWEMPLAGAASFSLSVSNPDLLTYPNQLVTFSGSAIATGGYSKVVSILCNAGPAPIPQTCSPTPPTLVPSASSTAFTVNATSSSLGIFPFRIQGVDLNGLTWQVPVSLRVIDFLLSSSSSSIANLPQGTSTTVQLTVNSLGSFDQQVTFACTGLPAGMTCSAPPVNLTPGGNGQSLLTITAGAATAAGTYNLNVSGTWAAASRTHTQPISVTVTIPTSAYTLSFGSTGSGTVDAGGIATGTLAITAFGTFNSAVNLTVSGCPANATCSLNPTTVSPTNGNSASSTLTITTKSNSSGQSGTPGGIYTIVVTGTSGTSANTAKYSLTVNDFNLSGSGSGATLKAGGTATGTFSVSATGSFNSTVSFTVSGCPTNATCNVSPTSVTPTSSILAATTLTVVTTAPTVSSLRGLSGQPNYLAMWIGLSFGAAGLVFLRRPRNTVALLVVACAMLLGMAACGGGGGSSGGTAPVPKPGTPAGTYTLVVTGTAGTTVKTANFTLTVQ